MLGRRENAQAHQNSFRCSRHSCLATSCLFHCGSIGLSVCWACVWAHVRSAGHGTRHRWSVRLVAGRRAWRICHHPPAGVWCAPRLASSIPASCVRACRVRASRRWRPSASVRYAVRNCSFAGPAGHIRARGLTNHSSRRLRRGLIQVLDPTGARAEFPVVLSDTTTRSWPTAHRSNRMLKQRRNSECAAQVTWCGSNAVRRCQEGITQAMGSRGRSATQHLGQGPGSRASGV